MGFRRNLLRRFLHDGAGSFVTNIAILAPVLLAAIAGGLDFAAYNQQKAAMQNAVDAAAIAAAREAALKGWTSKTADAVASSVFDSNYSSLSSNKKLHSVTTQSDEAGRKITVVANQDHYPYFAAAIFPSPQISVSATATSAGSANICVIGLDETQSGTVSLEGSAVLTAAKCAVYSNSKALDGLYAIKYSTLDAELTCSAGGTKRASGNFRKEPVTNCPQIADPLSSRPAPAIPSGCDHKNLVIEGNGTVETLSPGVYCNGLTIRKNAVVNFEPGTYIIKDGAFQLGANGKMFGRNVGFYFTGKGATFSLESGSTVDLEAPVSGSLAGLLFFQDRTADEADFLLRSNKASILVGTVYLPNGNFIIDTNSKVADQSAYTAIVARTLSLKRKPNVVLNTDYGATSVPVPAGIGSKDGNIRLLN